MFGEADWYRGAFSDGCRYTGPGTPSALTRWIRAGRSTPVRSRPACSISLRTGLPGWMRLDWTSRSCR